MFHASRENFPYPCLQPTGSSALMALHCVVTLAWVLDQNCLPTRSADVQIPTRFKAPSSKDL